MFGETVWTIFWQRCISVFEMMKYAKHNNKALHGLYNTRSSIEVIECNFSEMPSKVDLYMVYELTKSYLADRFSTKKLKKVIASILLKAISLTPYGIQK